MLGLLVDDSPRVIVGVDDVWYAEANDGLDSEPERVGDG